ncbi:unnamed protein product, partial [Meganyctiphanes norvegica]
PYMATGMTSAPGHLPPPTAPAHGYGGMSQEFLQTSIERAFASMATRYGHPSTWQTSGPPAQAPHEVMDERPPSIQGVEPLDDYQDMYDSRSLEEETPETRSASAKQLKETRLLHDALSSFFPSSFDHKEVQTPYYESHEDSSAHALLKIEPDITNTWFCPTPRYATDTIGYWPEAAKLPPGKR